jgi:hypothetical protein
VEDFNVDIRREITKMGVPTHPNEARWIKGCGDPERAVCQRRESHLSAVLQ